MDGMPFVGSHLWQIRQLVGGALMLVPGAQVLLLDADNRVLLQQRADDGTWALPAGACEENSTFASTAVTELREETGLVVDEADLVPFGCLSDPGVHIITYPNGDVTHCFAMCFEARAWHGTLRPEPGEVQDLGFFALDALPAPTHPPALAVLDLHAAYRRTGTFQAR